MPVRLQFIVMSSGEDTALLSQLVEALDPWPVLIHQDASRPRLALPPMRSGVRWMQPSLATGWGDWGFASAISLSIADALRHGNFDYLQLLSPSCLPIRPLADLIHHVSQDEADHHFDAFALDRDRDTVMSFAWRAFAPSNSERQKLLSRLRRWYFGESPVLEQQHSMSLLHRQRPAYGTYSLRAGAAVAFTRAMALDRPSTRAACAVGSVWFGARRQVCERMVEIAGSKHIRKRFESLAMVDELLIPTLLMHAGRKAGPSNHAVSPFDALGHPTPIDLPLLLKAASSQRFFARKFRPDPQDACRRIALEWAGISAAQFSGETLTSGRPEVRDFRSSPSGVPAG